MRRVRVGFVSDPSASMIIVAHHDRPARLDIEHPTAALPTPGHPVEVTDQGKNHHPVRGTIEDPTSPQVL